MKTGAIILTASAALVAACGPVAETQTFKSQQEQACYERVSAELPEGRELRRDSAGVFVEVATVDRFMRDIDDSEAFNACMAANRPAGSGGDIPTITFTAEELAIWRGLTDAARKDALEFIRNGGTLKEFVAQ
ncbi:hypothetical protein [Oceanibium sediminis]|uniref:hypothetical protein n=1 Tax=Oceanibium sediminis TaxID=2026339 RepID=UPI000DD3171B|nr:hypothetical protein [Oceanibium sediminis]